MNPQATRHAPPQILYRLFPIVMGCLLSLGPGSPARAYLGESESRLKDLYGEPLALPEGWASYIVESDINPGVLDQLKVLFRDGKVTDALVTHIEPKPEGSVRINAVPRRMREHAVNVGLALKNAGGKLVARLQRTRDYRELIYVYEIAGSGEYKSIRADYSLTETDQSVTYRYRVRFLPDSPQRVLRYLPDGLTALSRHDDPLEPLLQGR